MSLAQVVFEFDKLTYKNERNIPVAHFVEDVDEHMKGLDGVTDVLETLNTAFGKYKMMEQSIQSQKKGLMAKIPEIEKSLESVEFLLKKRGTALDISYELSNQVYARAHVEEVEKVGLWLGANVMCEYSLEEAVTLLRGNLEGAREQLKGIQMDLFFLSDQITTTEVNLARIYNWDVKQRRANKNAKK